MADSPEKRYLFHSNYPYFQALHLGRFLRGLAEIGWRLDADRAPTQQLCHIAWSAGNVIFKDRLFDPGVSAEEFSRRRTEEARRSALSETERERELEELVARLRRGEFEATNGEDAWRAPVKDPDRVREFLQRSHSVLEPLARFVVPGDSLLEDMVVRYLDGTGTRRKLRGIHGLFAAWDRMRMHHEGRPPFSIRFAPGFADSLQEAIAAEEREEPPADEVAAMLYDWSGPPEYRMRPREFIVARAGIRRARESKVISDPVSQAMFAQLARWER